MIKRRRFRCEDCRRKVIVGCGGDRWCVGCALFMTNHEYGIDQLKYEARR